MRGSEGDPERFREQCAVTDRLPIRDVYDIERRRARAQPVEHGPRRRPVPAKYVLTRRVRYDGLENDAETGVVRAGLFHELRIRHLIIHVGDDHFVALSRKEVRKMIVRGANASVPARAGDVRSSDADSLPGPRPVVTSVFEIRFEGSVNGRYGTDPANRTDAVYLSYRPAADHQSAAVREAQSFMEFGLRRHIDGTDSVLGNQETGCTTLRGFFRCLTSSPSYSYLSVALF